MQPDFTITDYITDSTWAAITIFVLLAIVFASTTLYYWRKSRRMAKSMLLQEHDTTDSRDDDADKTEDGEKANCVPFAKGRIGVKRILK